MFQNCSFKHAEASGAKQSIHSCPDQVLLTDPLNSIIFKINGILFWFYGGSADFWPETPFSDRGVLGKGTVATITQE